MSRVGRGLISSDDSTGAVTLPSAPTILPQIQGGFGQDVSAVTGSVVFYSGAAYFPDEFVTLEMFSGSTSATVATNTTAFNAAVATGKPIFIPRGSYNLNAVTKLTAPIVIFGTGRDSKLIFNTTGVGIELEDLTPAQNQTFYIHDLAFDNLTNVPAAFIRNLYAVNSRFEHLYFSDCAATYCIDNESGYGTKIADCVFSDVTGTGVRLRNSSDLTDYSFAAGIHDCDFTRLSVSGIEIEGQTSMNIIGGVIQSCAKGITITPDINNVGAWNINLYGTHFESNTVDIECDDDSVAYATINEVGVLHGGPSPVIDLGGYGRYVAHGCQAYGGAHVVVKGLAGSYVYLLSGNGHNFEPATLLNSASVFTGQWYDLGDYADAASTPAWLSSGVQPALGNGTLTSSFSRNGNRSVIEVYFKAGNTTTFGTGTYYFSDLGLTANPAVSPNEPIGTAMLYDATGAYRVGAVYIDSTSYGYQVLAVAFDATDANGFLAATVPWTWAVDDEIRLTISYRSTAS